MTRYIFIAVLSGALSACEQTIDVNVTSEPPIVVNALFTNDSTWRIRVDRAWSATEPTYYFDTTYDANGNPTSYRVLSYSKSIDNAMVQITSGKGEQIMLEYDTNGYYNGPVAPRFGESYTLSVNVPGQPLLSSSAYLPVPVPVDTAYFAGATADGLLLAVEFTDVPGPNTYELFAWSLKSQYDFYIPVKCDDPDVHVETYWTPIRGGEDQTAEVWPMFLSINDANFQERRKKLIIRTTGGSQDDEWAVRIRTLSSGYAKYRATSELQRNTSDDPFAESVRIFNNITNGVGIFAGYSAVDYHF